MKKVIRTHLRKIRLLIGFFFLIGLVAAITLLLTNAPSIAIAGGGEPPSTPTTIPTQVAPEIQILRDELNKPELSEFARESLEEKLEMAERMAAEQSSGANHARDEKVAPTHVPAAPALLMAQQPATGIFEGSQGLVSPAVAQITNVWQGVHKGYLWQVFAGSPADRSDLGILMIYIEDPVELKRSFEVVTAPGQPGQLRILEIKDNELILQTISESQLFFNLDTKEFHE